MTRVLLRDRYGRIAEIDQAGASSTELLAQAYASLDRMRAIEDGPPRHAAPQGDATAVIPRAR